MGKRLYFDLTLAGARAWMQLKGRLARWPFTLIAFGSKYPEVAWFLTLYPRFNP